MFTRHRHIAHRLTPTLGLVAALLVLAACSTDGKPGTTATSGTTTHATATTNHPAESHRDADPPALAGSRPNIIFIFTDDHAPHAISAYGSVINETPHIDRLANEGTLFRRSYCCNSICGPSRAAILTGLHSHANGFMQNGNRFDGHQQTFPQLLQRAGYQTALYGKWHLNSDPVGFDDWAILPGQGAYYNPDFIFPDGRRRVEGYCTDVATDMALEWLDNGRDADKPFVLMCQHKAPHRSWMPGPEELDMYDGETIPEPDTLFDDYAGRTPAAADNEMEIDRHMSFGYDLMCPIDDDEWLMNAYRNNMNRMTFAQRARWNIAFEEENAAFREAMPDMTHEEIVRWKYQRYIKNYLRCVAGVDRNVGRVLDWLDENPELAANTIVIYSSDQGFYLGDNGWYDKRWMYEESFAMPLIVRWPDHIPAGVENHELVQNIDYAPTFLDLAGVEPDEPMHGMSLVPLLEGDAELPGRDALYYHYYESRATHRVAAHYGIATDRYKLIHYYEPEWDSWELFDLQEDPDERQSVYGDPAYDEVQTRLHRELNELKQDVGNHFGGTDHPDLGKVMGITGVRWIEGGWLLTGSGDGAFAVEELDAPADTLSVTCTVRSEREDGIRNGQIALSDDGGKTVLRAGVYIGSGQYVVLNPAGQTIAEMKIAGEEPVEAYELIVEVADGTLTLTANGARMRVNLPDGFGPITHVGYGLNNTATRFTDLTVEAGE
ncbi:sulfatase [Phycisphaeraceae bacterium D3-23]